MDGTCDFVFEYQHFVVEAAYEDKDSDDDNYLIYARLGELSELQRKVRPMNLLKLLATWNGVLKQRRENDNDVDELTGSRKKKNTGLLRIDSSKADGPHVAFIYYGNVGEIEDAGHFQETMDDFVDDALEFSDMLHGTGMIEEEDEHQHKQEYNMERSSRVTAVVSSPTSDSRSGQRQQIDVGQDSVDGSSYFSESATTNSNSNNNSDVTTTKQPPQKETPNNNINNPPTINPAITTSDVYHANNKKSVFSKMIKSIRSKSNTNKDNNNIGSLAFVDPSNPACAFVVDKNAADEGNTKPTIVLSRKEPPSFHEGGTTPPARKRGSSFHDSGIAPNARKGGSLSTSFHSRGESPPFRDNRGFSHSSNRGSDEKGSRGDNNRSASSRRSSRGKKISSSFHHDEGSGSEYNYPNNVSNKVKSNSFHNHHYANISRKVKSKSFPNHHRKRSSALTEGDYDYDRSGQSVSHSPGANAIQFAHSEPVMGVSRSRRSEGDNSSRRYSSEVSQQQQRGHRKPNKRHSAHDENRRRGSSKSRGERSRRGWKGMN